MPTMLSNMAKLWLGTKSDLVSCLEMLVLTLTYDSMPNIKPGASLDVTDIPTVDVVIMVDAAVVNMLKPSTTRTFSDYIPRYSYPTSQHSYKIAEGRCSLG